jgi:hypothetical protein
MQVISLWTKARKAKSTVRSDSATVLMVHSFRGETPRKISTLKLPFKAQVNKSGEVQEKSPRSQVD